jgi:RHS repeat-associated protein
MRRETSSFYHYNHLGTALALTGADEAVSDTYRHDAWGVLLASTGSTVNPHTYVGRERYYRMPNAAMYHLGFRDYAQGLGRFTTVDPARWGANWGVNAANRPTVFVDPLGLQDSTPDCCDLLGALERQASNTMVRPNPWNCQWLNELLYRYLRSCGGFNPPLDKDLFPRPYPYPEPPAPPPPDLLKGVESPYTTWWLLCHSHEDSGPGGNGPEGPGGPGDGNGSDNGGGGDGGIVVPDLGSGGTMRGAAEGLAKWGENPNVMNPHTAHDEGAPVNMFIQDPWMDPAVETSAGLAGPQD